MNHFYHQLNKSHKNLHQDEYINQTSAFMKDALKHKDIFDSILVIGAGNLSDIALDFLCDKFHHIYLTDIDQESMNQALVEKQNRSKIKVIQVDYLGLDDVYFTNAFFHALRTKTKKQIEYDILQEINHILNHHFSVKFTQKFDAIYISPIYTQLLYRECEYKLNTNLSFLSQEIKEFTLSILLQEMTKILHHFNHEIMSLLHPDGIIFVASDIFLLTDNEFSLKVKKHIKNQEQMDEIHQSYLNQYGMGLGDFGLEDLIYHFQNVKKTWLLWGIQAHQSYAVQFCILKSQI